jgi:hypothetical protein
MQHFIDGEENQTPKTKNKIKLILFKIIFTPILIVVSKYIIRAIETKRQEKKYKKIIKKGLFWDTEYLIEK